MCDRDLTKLDMGAKDEDGNTAHDLLRIRNGLYWREYCQSKRIVCSSSIDRWGLKHEIEAIGALEKLLHHVQKSQGVPEADRYPPLGEYLSTDEKETAVPGA